MSVDFISNPAGAVDELVSSYVPSVLTESDTGKKIRDQVFGSGAPSSSSPIWKSIGDFFGGIFSWLKNLVVGIFDAKAIPLEKNLYARLGFDEKGAEKTGANPFASLDTALGVNVSAAVQDACKGGISNMAGWGGFSSDLKAGYQNSVDKHNEVYAIIYNALKDKYGRTAADEQPLKQIAEKAASSVSGLDPATLASEDAVSWIAKNPPTKGYAAMLATAQGNKESGGAAPAIALDTSGITQAQQQLAAFQNPSQAPSTAAEQQALAAANQNIRGGQQTDTVTPPPATRLSGAMRRAT
ncbi:MAG: hypothetical protein ACKVOE_03900 [Rickettsiales bacterium]